jgi:hypothetical protein
MISVEMLREAREAVEDLALAYGCPTVLFELVDRLEMLQKSGWREVPTDVPRPIL